MLEQIKIPRTPEEFAACLTNLTHAGGRCRIGLTKKRLSSEERIDRENTFQRRITAVMWRCLTGTTLRGLLLDTPVLSFTGVMKGMQAKF